MKLLLHWLRWDLRRFRWPLLMWTTLVTGFVCYIGWLHLNILTIPSSLLSYNEGIAAVLGIIEFFLLLHILTTDPAAGVRPFWKTRPPSGFALAGAKATLAVGFFVALPMLALWLMRLMCDLGAERSDWSGRSWMWMVWWTECLTLSALGVAASGARNAGHALGRLAAAAGVLFVPVLISMPLWEKESAPARWMEGSFRHIHEGIFSLVPVTVWLLAGLAVFILIRRTRTPPRLLNAAPLFLPAAALITGAGLAEKEQPRWRDPVLPALPAEMAAALKIGEPLLRGGVESDSNFYAGRGASSSAAGFRLALHLSGLPGECLAAAKWQSLRLVHPNGQSLAATEEELHSHPLPWQIGPNLDADSLLVSGIRFPAASLAAFSLEACRGEGVLRVILLRRQERVPPIERGQRMELGQSTLLVSDLHDLTAGVRGSGVPGHSWSGRDLMHIAVRHRSRDELFPQFWLQHVHDPPQHMDLMVNGGGGTSGYFMHHSRGDWPVCPAQSVSPVASALVKRAVEQGTLADWKLHVSWYEPEGIADVPVVLEHLFIPRQPGDERNAADVLAALRITPAMTPAEVKRTVKLALALTDLSRTQTGDVKTDPFIAALQRFLGTVPRERLPMLLEVAEEDLPPGNMMMQRRFDWPLRKIIASHLEAADVATLREKKPRLLRYVRFDLVERKLFPYREAHGPDREDSTSDQLRSEWQKSKFAPLNWLSLTPLEYALRRGLPWAAAELLELVELVPGELGSNNFIQALSKISDCPADYEKAIPWLRANAARLTWDAAVKRWVSPVTP